MKLSPIVKNMLKNDQTTRLTLALAFERSELTIKRWIESDNLMMTHDKAIEIIEKGTGLKRNKIVTK